MAWVEETDTVMLLEETDTVKLLEHTDSDVSDCDGRLRQWMRRVVTSVGATGGDVSVCNVR